MELKDQHPEFFEEQDPELRVDDDKAMRFLVARELDLAKTANMLLYDIEFRRQYRPKSISQDHVGIKKVLDSGCWRLMGQSKLGRVFCRA